MTAQKMKSTIKPWQYRGGGCFHSSGANFPRPVGQCDSEKTNLDEPTQPGCLAYSSVGFYRGSSTEDNPSQGTSQCLVPAVPSSLHRFVGTGGAKSIHGRGREAGRSPLCSQISRLGTGTLLSRSKALTADPPGERRRGFAGVGSEILQDFGLGILYGAYPPSQRERTAGFSVSIASRRQLEPCVWSERGKVLSLSGLPLIFIRSQVLERKKDLLNHLVSIISAELFPAGHLLVVCQLQFRKLSCSVQYNGF